MNWEDGLALLIVAGAALGLARIGFSTLRGNRRQSDAEAAPPAASGDCQGCALGSCPKTRISR